MTLCQLQKDVGKEAIAKIYSIDLKGADRNIDAGADLGAFERIERKITDNAGNLLAWRVAIIAYCSFPS